MNYPLSFDRLAFGVCLGVIGFQSGCGDSTPHARTDPADASAGDVPDADVPEAAAVDEGGVFRQDAASAPSVQVTVTPARPTICAGQCVDLSASATGGVPPYTYDWNVATDGGAPHVCPTQTTTYSVTATDSEGGELPAQHGLALVKVTVGPSCSNDGGVPSCMHAAPSGSFEPALQWSWAGPAGETNSMVIPLVANLTDDNGDGRIDLSDVPDVVVVTYGSGNGGHVSVLDGATGHLHVTFGTNVGAYMTPALGDLDGDGIPEIVTIDTSFRLVAFHHDGTVAWTGDTVNSAYFEDSIAIANVDGAGAPEIIAGNAVYDAQGKSLWTAPAGTKQGTIMSPFAADLDGDGKLEVLFGNVAFRFDGTPYFDQSTIAPGPYVFAQVANLDADPQPEVLITSMRGSLILGFDGKVKRDLTTSSPSGNSEGFPASIQDVDGDGVPDFGVSNGVAYSIFRPDGTAIWSAKVRDASGIAAGTAFDFLGSGKSVAMYADETTMYAWDATGTPLFMQPRRSGTLTEYPVVADIDNDGSAEVLIVSNGDSTIPPIQAIRDKMDRWVPARRIWNENAYHVTNVNEDGTIPVHEAPNFATLNTFRVQAQAENGVTCTPPKH